MKCVLAPMQDVTDLALMRCLQRIGSLPDEFVTPYFRSTASSCAMGEANLRCIHENETGRPIWAQLAGSDAAPLVRDAAELMRLPIAGINLNAGCPSPLVNRHGAGAALLRDLPRFLELLLRLRDLLPAGRFSVKCRLGWANEDEFPAIIDCLAEAQPDEVCIHGRTRKQLYSGHAQAEPARLAVQRLRCPVLGNGDIQSIQDAKRWQQEATPSGVMIGRGAVRNPYLFRMLRGGPAPTREEMQDYFRILIEETARTFIRSYSEKGHCQRIKKYLSFCYADRTPEEEYRLRRCTRISDMESILCQN